MSLSENFAIWNKLSEEHRKLINERSELRTVKKGTVVHNGNMDCLGMLLIRSGQLRAYILSEEGREITIYRMFEQDVCILSASCIMPNIQFEIIIEAEKDTEFWVIPSCLYKKLMEESLPVSQ